ncbi:MAG: hypothetical protein JRI23_24350, partial [Deltaproteobacteria bacterium]|nr:hypothetical protein [Deltaproteobacteria bacterium]MBW2535137.1 hypothetical protein [Deltaproteobacteria bacterium]
LLSASLAARRRSVRGAARKRYRRAGRRVALGVLAFWLVAGIPPLLWRLRFGTWLH